MCRATASCCVEWPDRLPDTLPPNRFDYRFTLAPERGPDFREVRLTGYGACAARVERLHAGRRFLEQAGFGAAHARTAGGRCLHPLSMNG